MRGRWSLLVLLIYLVPWAALGSANAQPKTAARAITVYKTPT